MRSTRAPARPFRQVKTNADLHQDAVNLVGRWNHLCGPGAPVGVRLEANGPEYATKTRGTAWAIGPNALVLVEGLRGGQNLTSVRLLKDGEKLEPIPTMPAETGGGAA